MRSRRPQPKLDHGCLWVGGPDEETLYAFMRGKDGAFTPDKNFSGDAPSVYLDPELAAMIARFSPAVTEFHLLDHAAEALIDWARADAASVQADIRLLSAIRKRLEVGAKG